MAVSGSAASRIGRHWTCQCPGWLMGTMPSAGISPPSVSIQPPFTGGQTIGHWSRYPRPGCQLHGNGDGARARPAGGTLRVVRIHGESADRSSRRGPTRTDVRPLGEICLCDDDETAASSLSTSAHCDPGDCRQRQRLRRHWSREIDVVSDDRNAMQRSRIFPRHVHDRRLGYDERIGIGRDDGVSWPLQSACAADRPYQCHRVVFLFERCPDPARVRLSLVARPDGAGNSVAQQQERRTEP